jgi:basic membrane protein A
LRADTDSTGFVKVAGRQQLKASTIEKLQSAYEAVRTGVVVPASNFGGFTPEQFIVK